jgi:hypothetical protein
MNDFHKDDRVLHWRFGPGIVIDVDARYTVIEFDAAGVRKFVTGLVQLERSDLPVPVKPAPQRRRRASSRRSVAAEPPPDSQVIHAETKPRRRRDAPEPEEPT